MKTSARLAIIQPRLDGHGGLEKYGVFVIETLSQDQLVDVILEHEVDLAKVERAFGVNLSRARFICDPRCTGGLTTNSGFGGRMERSRTMRDYATLTAPYDLVIGQSVGLPLRSGARRSILLCHFPVVRNEKVSPDALLGWKGLLSSEGRIQRAIHARLSSWTQIVCNSAFTRHWIQRYWAREAEIINPPIELPAAPDFGAKKNWIVAVGFFSKPPDSGKDPWSYKRQELLIETFCAMCDAGLKGWELHLAGHVLPPTPETHSYVGELQARADNYPVTFHPNCSHDELLDLYRHGSIYWHATGYGLDAELEPERMEHFGMVTAEAMGWGCVPVVINSGGQPEIVVSGQSGFLWDTLEDFRHQTLSLVNNPVRLDEFGRAAVERAGKFGLSRFRSQIASVVERELALTGRSRQ